MARGGLALASDVSVFVQVQVKVRYRRAPLRAGLASNFHDIRPPAHPSAYGSYRVVCGAAQAQGSAS